VPSNPSFRRPHWVARPVTPLGHEALLTLARKVRAAAADTDPQRLEEAAQRFSTALDRHLKAEAAAMSGVVPAEARLLRKGQKRICKLAAALLHDAAHECPVSHPDCRSRAEELVALLSLQARDEHRALDRPAPRTLAYFRIISGGN
jgi:hypothetical protein